ncbi:biotin/lipoyl-containing protein [Polaribacter sp. Hel1_85]|uniref:biotin/lipoyl-containing protein n=1 Tax=Polaribacter sp. Hel1_85 TaxID=1250005 RepID=UPI00052D12DF|nr:biotin/lipoyl-containing protein [Polaribacter sp. Hel1_85]KGL63354.1 biotin carboxyl carrier protein of methylmalonyl-CoA decarboxylase [Polaribacter sp. Hel1_85]
MKSYKFKINDNGYTVKIKSHENNTINLEVNGTLYEVKMKEDIKKTKTPTLVRAASKRPAEPLKVNPKSQKTRIVAPIPGVVLSIDVKVGDTLKVGDRMLVLEAMKMENSIVCEKAGTITDIKISVGQQVLHDELMIELE